jgi:TolA-binding protein
MLAKWIFTSRIYDFTGEIRPGIFLFLVQVIFCTHDVSKLCKSGGLLIAYKMRVCYFLPSIVEGDKENIVGTTKLTRKEILAEDQAHKVMVALIEFLNLYKKTITILCIVAILAGLGIYGGSLFLGKKEMTAQEVLGRGIDFYHAEVNPDASDNPFENGPVAVFRSDTLKYQAAAREFSSIESVYGFSKVFIIARYYLGLAQLKLGEKEEAVKNLEMVSNNSKARTVGYLAKRVLSRVYTTSGNTDEAKKLLRSMIADAKYDLPKEDLSIQLSRILVAEGNNEEAVKVLQEASSQGSEFSNFKQKLVAELDKVRKTIRTEPES